MAFVLLMEWPTTEANSVEEKAANFAFVFPCKFAVKCSVTLQSTSGAVVSFGCTNLKKLA